jgi:mannose-6-phosphate isomerase
VSLYPLTFRPIFKERLWGRRTLQDLYGKALPPAASIGESWEISDRPGDVSVVDSGPLAGRDLHWLIEHFQKELLGPVALQDGRFPLLAKILDAQEKLSLQVHPPASVAAQLHGEPKTEVWYLAQAQPGAELFAGLKRGITRQRFEQQLHSGQVAECFHRLPVHTGDTMFVPSGRVHGIGAGCVIFEFQQNSDTTYRVFDWNRVDRDGKPRALHIAESLASINFSDFEPSLIDTRFSGPPEAQVRPLISCPWFDAEVRRLAPGAQTIIASGPAILAVAQGELQILNDSRRVSLPAGGFCLIPAALPQTALAVSCSTEFLVVQPK